MIKYVPNALTIFRILLTPLFLYLAIYCTGPAALMWKWIIFVSAMVTDWLDGLIARRYDIITNFGKIFDPLADKIIVLSAIGVLVWKSPFRLSWLVFAIIALREIGVTVLRDIYARRNIIIPADKGGKLKTVMQMAGITFSLGCWALGYTAMPITAAIQIWFWLTTAITIWSGINYFMVKR